MQDGLSRRVRLEVTGRIMTVSAKPAQSL